MIDRAIRLCAGSAVVALAAALIATSGLAAQTGRVSSAPTVTCGPQRAIAVSAAGLLPLDSPVAVAEYWGWVAYRAHVWRWNGTAWTPVSSGPWVAYQASNLGKRRSFYTYQNNAWVAGVPGSFTLGTGGYYTVTVDYYWFSIGGGDDSLSNQWVKSYVDARGPTGSAWCAVD